MNIKKAAAAITIFLGVLIAAALTNTTNAATQSVENTRRPSTSETSADEQLTRQEMEQKILNSTVRLLMYSPLMHVEGFGMKIINSMGHGTIKDGRYLVTHNHYDETLFSIMQAGDPDNLLTVEILNTEGAYLAQVRGQEVTVVLVENETVVFDFGTVDGAGFFTALGLSSAEFLSQFSVELQAGMEVAQIDWDGSSSHIDWVTVEETTIRTGTPIVKVTNYILKGASGGGVFYQGAHIGNNWSRLAADSQGLDSDQTPNTTVALNSETVVAP